MGVSVTALDEIETELKAAITSLNVPAAEYVPAIPTAWGKIENAISSLREARHHAAEASGADKPLLPRLLEVREAIVNEVDQNKALATLNEIINEMQNLLNMSRGCKEDKQ